MNLIGTCNVADAAASFTLDPCPPSPRPVKAPPQNHAYKDSDERSHDDGNTGAIISPCSYLVMSYCRIKRQPASGHACRVRHQHHCACYSRSTQDRHQRRCRSCRRCLLQHFTTARGHRRQQPSGCPGPHRRRRPLRRRRRSQFKDLPGTLGP